MKNDIICLYLLSSLDYCLKPSLKLNGIVYIKIYIIFKGVAEIEEGL